METATRKKADLVIRGVGSLLDIGGTLRIRRRFVIYSNPDNDFTNLANDWQHVGDDLRSASLTHEKTTK